MEQQAISDFSVTKCILAESSNNSVSSCSEQTEKNANSNNELAQQPEVKQEGDSTLSGKWHYSNIDGACLGIVVQYNDNITGFFGHTNNGLALRPLLLASHNNTHQQRDQTQCNFYR